MLQQSIVLCLAISSVVVAHVLFKFVHASRIKKLMPPGPPGIPLLGNALQVPKDQPFRQFAEWAKVYGPVFSLNLVGKDVVVLSSPEVAKDLLDRRSAKYSDRPRFIMANEIILGGMATTLLPYGDRWRRHHRAIHDSMNMHEVDVYSAAQEREASKLIQRLLDDPDNWLKHTERSIASSVFSIVYGNILDGKDYDGIMQRLWHAMNTVSRVAGKEPHLVDFFPVMLYIPEWLAKWKREGMRVCRMLSGMFEEFFEGRRAERFTKEEHQSFSERMIKAGDKYGFDPSEPAWLAGLTLITGVDTSCGMLSVFMLAMLWHPDVMRRAQEELDAVVGRGRLPTLDDYDNLPYVVAIVKEMLRWWPVAPLGLPRRTTEDDWYNGYFIPKGTMILANLWAMGRDPAEFPDPEDFRPERFLAQDDEQANLQTPFAFGFGRRICPGMHVAMRTLFVDIACILWALDIKPQLSEDGSPIRPGKTEAIDGGLTVFPVRFPCSIRPRFRGVRDTCGGGKRRKDLVM